jgi:hypothetical protein
MIFSQNACLLFVDEVEVGDDVDVECVVVGGEVDAVGEVGIDLVGDAEVGEVANVVGVDMGSVVVLGVVRVHANGAVVEVGTFVCVLLKLFVGRMFKLIGRVLCLTMSSLFLLLMLLFLLLWFTLFGSMFVSLYSWNRFCLNSPTLLSI